MLKPLPNDIWVSASGVDNSQIVYHIEKLFINSPGHLYNPNYRKGVEMVLYRVMNSKGKVRILSYPVKHFLNKPVYTNGLRRKLAVRVNSGH